MRVLIDTNIILYILLARIPFLEPAKKLIRMLDEGRIYGYITANSITDIVYVARKTHSREEIRRIILDLLDRITVIGIDREVSSCAKINFTIRSKSDIIHTWIFKQKIA